MLCCAIVPYQWGLYRMNNDTRVKIPSASMNRQVPKAWPRALLALKCAATPQRTVECLGDVVELMWSNRFVGIPASGGRMGREIER